MSERSQDATRCSPAPAAASAWRWPRPTWPRARAARVVDRAAEPTARGARRCCGAHPDALHYVGADVTDSDAHRAHGRRGARTLRRRSTCCSTTPRCSTWRRCCESDEAMYERLFAVNVKGMFFVMQAVLRADGRGEAPAARVINLASQAGRRGEALVSHYCATKAAVISYTQSAALAMAPHGIRVNAIAPGVIDTPMWAAGRRAVRALRGPAAGREEAPRRQGGAARPHGRARGHRRRRGVPGQRRGVATSPRRRSMSMAVM